MKKIFLIIIIITIIGSLSAEKYSIKKAIFYSACIPGLGQAYTDSNKSAGTYIAAELAFIFAYFQLNHAEENKFKSIKSYAHTSAGAAQNNSEDYYADVENYMSSDAYNEQYYRAARLYINQNLDNTDFDSIIQEANDYIEDNIYTGEDVWEWNSRDEKNKISKMYDQKHYLEIYSRIAAVSMILNRMVSMIDVARIVKIKNKIIDTEKISFKPDYKNKGLMINYEFKF